MAVAQDVHLKIAKEFSETPGPRARDEGDFSGEQFLDELLAPKYEQAQREHSLLTVDFDGTEGYATSFLEAAFGGLARKYGVEAVHRTVRFKSNDEPYLIDEVNRYIDDANKK